MVFNNVVKLFQWCFNGNSSRIANLRSRWKFWKRRSLTLNRGDQTYHVTYLGNVPTYWAKGDQCIETPLNMLWQNYERKRGKKAQTKMKIVICNTGMRVHTRDIAEMEYWSNRISYVTNMPTHPQVFVWVYRHVGKRGKPEMRCHAVLCRRAKHAQQMCDELRVRLYNALREFRRELNLRQNMPNNMLPMRKRFLVKGSSYFKQPLERSQSAPKLDSIVEAEEDEPNPSAPSSPLLVHSQLIRQMAISTGQLNC
ncbi:hypothetical protein RDWZM_007057 [Blomia tropicalis]|uniref:PID domain-containing protein n=1 Tax=Blomia tropicalis TaxID=40697 RepID=A0A9Q0RP61_BLOTA|nr:Protein fam43a [Blomia tropicalis]KAJ6221245.1 hypothetical protein RDWZM_007057 [Blomia tropicalis]